MSCGESAPIKARVAATPKTFCNPVNIDYRFMKINGGEGIREAADPVVVSYKDKYYLFASKSSGYWCSDDFTDWKHVFITDSVFRSKIMRRDFLFMITSFIMSVPHMAKECCIVPPPLKRENGNR